MLPPVHGRVHTSSRGHTSQAQESNVPETVVRELELERLDLARCWFRRLARVVPFSESTHYCTRCVTGPFQDLRIFQVRNWSTEVTLEKGSNESILAQKFVACQGKMSHGRARRIFTAAKEIGKIAWTDFFSNKYPT